MGATVVTTPGGEIASALKSGGDRLAPNGSDPGSISGSGLDKAADYYYYPGFPRARLQMSTLGINKTLWDGLTPSETRV